MSERYILILGAGLMQRPSIEAAKELGYKALVVDANPNAVCVPFADRFEKIDLKDSVAIADFAYSLGDDLCAVFTAGTDFSVSVALAAEKCGLISHSYQSAMNASNKILMRKCFKEHGIPSPDFFEADEKYIENFADTSVSIKFPKVIKPVDNMGARGCRLVRNDSEFISALKEAVKFSRTKKVIVEDYMDGPEFSIDALVINGKVIITGFADRHIFFKPYFIELGHTMPSEISDDKKSEIVSVFSAAVRSLGLTCGVAKGDVKYTEKGPMIGEIAARLSGGYMSGWTFPYSSGFDLTKAAMKISLGITPEFSDKDEIPSVKYSHERAFISIPGKIKSFYGVEKAWASPFVKNIFFRVKEGDEVDFPRNNVEKCGNVISCSEIRQLSLDGAESSVAHIVIRLETGNSKTDDFIKCVEKPYEKGFPFSAFDLDMNIFETDIKEFPVIQENDSVKKYIPSALKKIMNEKKDWNHRTISDTLNLFDEISPLHPELDSEKFWNYLLRGGIQAVLYYSDSLERGYEI